MKINAITNLVSSVDVCHIPRYGQYYVERINIKI